MRSSSSSARARRRVALAVLVLAAGCAGPQARIRAPEFRACRELAPVTESIYLIGDAGDPKLARGDSSQLVDPVLLALRGEIEKSVSSLGPGHVRTIFLGDNVYWDGLPATLDHPDRRHGERVLEAQAAASAPGEAVFVLGNHDWNIQGSKGWRRALAQREFLSQFAPRVRMLPEGGCTGPERLDIGDWLRIVFIDPIAFDHLGAHPQEHKWACSGRDVLSAYRELGWELRQRDGRHTALALHHPLITSGPHGGFFTWKQHIFPLTDFWRWAWIPLPGIGSIYPIARQLGVTGTDTTSRAYEAHIRGIYRAASPESPDFFMAGHEHSLQVHRDAVGAHYLVSGAGSSRKVDRVEESPTLLLGVAQPGFMRLDVRENGALDLIVLGAEQSTARPLFEHCLAEGPPSPSKDPPRLSRDPPSLDRATPEIWHATETVLPLPTSQRPYPAPAER